MPAGFSAFARQGPQGKNRYRVAAIPFQNNRRFQSVPGFDDQCDGSVRAQDWGLVQLFMHESRSVTVHGVQQLAPPITMDANRPMDCEPARDLQKR